MRYTIGLDVHKRETEACVLNDTGSVVDRKRFQTKRAAYRRALAKYSSADVVIEAVGFHRPVASWLKELGLDVHLANTREIPKPAIKHDKKDARHLARLKRADVLPESYLAPEPIQELRDLGRHRQFLGEQTGRLGTKIRHDLYKHGHFVNENPADTVKGRAWLRKLDIPEITSTVNMLEIVLQEVKQAEERIEAVLVDLPAARLLTTIPGVGNYLALVIAAEVGDFHRFRDGEQLASYAGLVPRQDQSGDKDRRGRITRRGNDTLRWALGQAARNHVRYCPESRLSKRFERLAEEKGYGCAITATARALCPVIHCMVTRHEEFKVNP